MNNFRPKFFVILVLATTFACSEKDEKSQVKTNYAFEVVDSVLVNYLGDMIMLDYDAPSEKYLISQIMFQDFLEVDESGKILNQYAFSQDGVNPINTTMGLGYFDGKVTVFDSPKGYISFEDSSIVDEVLIPYPSHLFMMYPKLGMFELGERVYYPKPWAETLKISMSDGAFYKALMEQDILESQDLETGDTLGHIKLPESSPLLGDGIHGFPIPTYTLVGDKLLLSMWLEPRFYVYSVKNDAFEYEKTVEIDIPGWVPYTTVPEDNADAFFEENMKKSPGNLTNLFQIGEHYIAVYNRGLTEDQMNSMNRLDPSYESEIRKKNPNLIAVFDQEFKQLASNVSLPVPASFPNVVNRKGELVVSKDPYQSEVEDDGIMIYKLKLVEN